MQCRIGWFDTRSRKTEISATERLREHKEHGYADKTKYFHIADCIYFD